MRIVTLLILFSITIAGWGSGILTTVFGRSAGYEILAAIYFLTGTVAFAAARSSSRTERNR